MLLVRKETSPEDVAGMHLAQGILTATGGKASHAAVVARGWGKPCVVGCGALQIDEAAGQVYDQRHGREGGRLHHDRRRRRGDVMIGQVPTVDPTISGYFATLMSWADKVRTLKVRTNCRHAGRLGPAPARSGPRESACAAPSTCSSATSESSPCGR